MSIQAEGKAGRRQTERRAPRAELPRIQEAKSKTAPTCYTVDAIATSKPANSSSNHNNDDDSQERRPITTSRLTVALAVPGKGPVSRSTPSLFDSSDHDLRLGYPALRLCTAPHTQGAFHGFGFFERVPVTKITR